MFKSFSCACVASVVRGYLLAPQPLWIPPKYKSIVHLLDDLNDTHL